MVFFLISQLTNFDVILLTLKYFTLNNNVPPIPYKAYLSLLYKYN